LLVSGRRPTLDTNRVGRESDLSRRSSVLEDGAESGVAFLVSPRAYGRSGGDGLRRGALRTMATTYNPGEIVPKDGTVKCTQFNGTRDKVKKGTKFAPCDHWGDHHGKKCTWQYV
jgi:hypothetical protein